ncbi:MAG: hypothetical protein LAO03_19805 [Acidobacteriia bacterium]|nr:hypothetical protein [Terriglobia bacterium]
MNRPMEWIDRLKLVEGLMLFGTVWFGVEWFGSRFGGTLGIVVAIASFAVLYTPYCWWRGKGIFRNRS